MCLSPEVDLAAGIVIAAIGVDTLRRVDHPNERPLAALPLILGAHQVVVGGNVAARIGPT